MPHSTNTSTLIARCIANNREKQAKRCIADAYALQILFVYFLILPSLLHPSILLFFILVIYRSKHSFNTFNHWHKNNNYPCGHASSLGCSICIHVCVYMEHMTYRDDVKCPLFFVNIYYSNLVNSCDITKYLPLHNFVTNYVNIHCDFHQ